MPFFSTEVILQAHYPDHPDRRVAMRNFLCKLSFSPDDTVGPGRINPKRWVEPEVQLGKVSVGDLEDHPDPYSAYLEGVENGLLESAAWLEKQPIRVFEEMHKQGLHVEVLIETVYIDGDDEWVLEDLEDEEGEDDLWDSLHRYAIGRKLVFDIPAAFLKACGERGIPISFRCDAEHSE